MDRLNVVEPLWLKELALLDGAMCAGLAGVSGLDARVGDS